MCFCLLYSTPLLGFRYKYFRHLGKTTLQYNTQLCKLYNVVFAQHLNRLRTHFIKRITDVKRCISVILVTGGVTAVAVSQCAHLFIGFRNFLKITWNYFVDSPKTWFCPGHRSFASLTLSQKSHNENEKKICQFACHGLLNTCNFKAYVVYIRNFYCIQWF